METGFHNLSNDDYHKEEAIGNSDLKLFHRSPAHYRAKELKKDTPALVFGNFYHIFNLQPHLVEQNYIQAYEGFDGRKDKDFLSGRAYLNGISFKPATGNNTEIVISWNDWQKVEAMKKALYADPTASALLSAEGPREISGFWIDKRTGLPCKLRADFINSATRIVGDLKSTTDASEEGFGYQMTKLRYHWQAAHYLNGVSVITQQEHKDFVFIAQEKDPPYAPAVYRLEDSDVYLGQEEIKPLMDRMRECKQDDKWPGYSNKVEPISLRDWYVKKAQI